MRPDPRALARAFEEHVRERCGAAREVALLLGAGVDGTTVGLAAHHAGYRVRAYTFQLGDARTHDSKWAERTAAIMGWPWTCVRLPTHVRAVVRAWPRMYRELHCRKKREFECTWPFLYVYPVIREEHVLTGLHAGVMFGLGRAAVRAGAAGAKGSRGAFDDLRRGQTHRIQMQGERALSFSYNPSCLRQHLLLQRENGQVHVDPFIHNVAYPLLMRHSWIELNTPKQKTVLRETYADHQRVGVRNHRGYQEAGGITRHFEQVLDTPVNFMRRSRVIDMCSADWASENPERIRARETVLRRIERAFPRG